MANRRPILYKGELYSTPIGKSSGGPGKEPQQNYREAKDKLANSINQTRNSLAKLSKETRLPNEVVLCLRLNPDFSAKSYYPTALLDEMSQVSEFEEIGSRTWQASKKTDPQMDSPDARLLFIRATDDGLVQLEKKLSTSESELTKKFTLDVRRVVSLDLLTADERILGVPEGWEEGRLEAVLHPFRKDRTSLRDHFMQLLRQANVDEKTIKLKQYDGGITFVSLRGNRKLLTLANQYNPLRMLHPLEARGLPVFRGGISDDAPQPPHYESKSKIVVGMFDGGALSTNPYLEKYTDSVHTTLATPDQDAIMHATAVAGVILYGPLNNFHRKDKLPEPIVSVKSFRVLPTLDPKDIDLYEVIDAIEDTIPKEKDIKVYNLSLGPVGPILKDHVSRFTYALDLLAEQYNVLFCVAVGNDGDAPEPLNGIQAPSDMVNGLAVAAYTIRGGKIERAPYSCIGPGREGNKLKPDIAAWGGCDQSPLHLLSTTPGKKVLWWGTSFATPVVSSIAGQLIGRSNGSMDSLIARALIIHNSTKISKSHTTEFGHGILDGTVEDVVSCSDKSYTLIYQGEILPGKFAKLEVPWVRDSRITGKVAFRWTLSVMAPIDQKSPDDYTSCSLLASFYPNSKQYVFKNKLGQTKRVDVENDPVLARQLTSSGWEQNTYPISDSGPLVFAQEDALRADNKWDTIDHREKTKRDGSNIKLPMFHIHAIARGNHHPAKKIRYALVLTVETPKSPIDIYSAILQQYPALIPLKLMAQNEVRVQA